MSDHFGGREFAAGTVTGLRTFHVADAGTLLAPARRYAGEHFTAGENVAACHLGLAHVIQAAFFQAVPSWMRSPSASTHLARYNQDEHRPGSVTCQCGFYAYTDGSNEIYDANDPTEMHLVEAIIEGYGVVSIGTRGFRCEKARLVALVEPTRVRRDRFYWAWAAALVCAVVVHLAIHVTTTGWEGFAAAAASAGVVVHAGTQVLRRHRAWRAASAGSRALLQRVRLAEADLHVPVHATRESAIAAHPLTDPGPAPEPEPDPMRDYAARRMNAAMAASMPPDLQRFFSPGGVLPRRDQADTEDDQ